MIKGNCHCGAVTFELREDVEWLTECNCSICRRLGTTWAHAEMSKVTVDKAEDATLAYSWGDRELVFHTCKGCGCTTHWVKAEPGPDEPMAVNCRLSEPETIAHLRVRAFDGANTWKYLD